MRNARAKGRGYALSLNLPKSRGSTFIASKKLRLDIKGKPATQHLKRNGHEQAA